MINALTPTADNRPWIIDIRFVSKADSATFSSWPARSFPVGIARTMRARRPSGPLKKIFERGVSVRKYEQPDRYVDAARSLNNLPFMFRREYICIEVGNPLLAFLGDSQVAQSISDIRLHDLPIKMRIICP